MVALWKLEPSLPNYLGIAEKKEKYIHAFHSTKWNANIFVLNMNLAHLQQ